MFLDFFSQFFTFISVQILTLVGVKDGNSFTPSA